MMKPHNLNQPEHILKQFCEGYKKRDLSFMLSLFTQNATLWGTGVDECRKGPAEIRQQLLRDWQQSDSAEINIISFTQTPIDSLWTAAICSTTITIAGKKHYFENFRSTIILEKEKNEWKIVHMHTSFPDFRNPDAYSFPIKDV